ncbi:hypothetical protein C7B79_03425 [Chroococcidiopsis cubana CCALA 043]|nr:hypothetical protein C7B79_03425 [Chroococcidiopsis cubana CCALA 043]
MKLECDRISSDSKILYLFCFPIVANIPDFWLIMLVDYYWLEFPESRTLMLNVSHDCNLE